jgi:hypothetical protein
MTASTSPERINASPSAKIFNGLYFASAYCPFKQVIGMVGTDVAHSDDAQTNFVHDAPKINSGCERHWDTPAKRFSVPMADAICY